MIMSQTGVSPPNPSPLWGGMRRVASQGGGVIAEAVMANLRARSLRSSMTDPERHLWKYLRVLKPTGSHFRRQVPMGSYIVDFCCHSARLVVEVDGGHHGNDEQAVRDETRTAW